MSTKHPTMDEQKSQMSTFGAGVAVTSKSTRLRRPKYEYRYNTSGSIEHWLSKERTKVDAIVPFDFESGPEHPAILETRLRSHFLV